MNAPRKHTPVDPIAALEQRFTYRVHEYLSDGRSVDAEFRLPGLRGWMLSQQWPDPPASRKLECLAVLSWNMICRAESEPEHEGDFKRELGQQLDYLDGSSARRPASLDAVLSSEGRAGTYASLRKASEPGSAHRKSCGLPRFNAAKKLP